MTTLNISLPDSMRGYIDEKVKAEGYSTASEYVRALIREDQKRQAQESLEVQLLEGLTSGSPEKLTAEGFDSIRDRLRKKSGGRKARVPK
ncbi:MAG: type II toxin-antitoxin system ParD family antitoxin [Candidatus Hydrogenedentales bacterium]|jgi:antitoxin ParD1/3/4